MIATTNQDKGQLYDKICSTLDPSDSPKQKRQKFVKFLREKYKPILRSYNLNLKISIFLFPAYQTVSLKKLI